MYLIQTLHFLVLSVLSGEAFPGFHKFMRSTGGLNGYIKLSIGGNSTIATTAVYAEGKNNLSLEFDEELWVPLWIPTPSKRISISLYHKEFGRSDLLVSTAYLELDNIKVFENDPISGGGMLSFSKMTYEGPKFEYLNFYGADQQVRSGEYANLMNR